VAFRAKHVKPAPAAEAQRIAALIADLDSEQLKVRDWAAKELEKLGEVAAPALPKAAGGGGVAGATRRLGGGGGTPDARSGGGAAADEGVRLEAAANPSCN
jgi:hypothetical protein